MSDSVRPHRWQPTRLPCPWDSPGKNTGVLEWVAISFSNAWKWKVKVKSLSGVRLLATPWTAAHQAALSMGFSRQEYWSRVPLPLKLMYIFARSPIPLSSGNHHLCFYLVILVHLLCFIASILSALWRRKVKRLMEASWWERLRGKLGLVLIGRAMLSKFLIQSSVDCVPVTWGQTMVEIMKIWWRPPSKGPILAMMQSVPPALQQASSTDSWTLMGRSGSVSCGVTAPFSCIQYTQGFVCALQGSVSLVLCKFWCLNGGFNGDLLQEGLCHTQVYCTQSPCPCSSPLLTCTSTGDTQTQFWLSLCGVSGSWCTQCWFEPSELLWLVWGFILIVISHLLPSCWVFSFALGNGDLLKVTPAPCSRHSSAVQLPSSQNCGFSSGHVWMWELDYKKSWAPKNCCFWTGVLEKTLESPLDFKEIKPVHSKRNQCWIFIERTDAEA